MTTTAVITPYKGLAPFDDSDLDALLFFGRESESEIVAMNLLASRLTVLYGPSGVGKSSLLRAGVARRVRELAPEADIVVFGAWRDDPIAALREEVSPDAPADVTLVDAIALRDRELYLVLDQFEEYFLYHADARGADTIGEQLPELVNRTDLQVNVLLGIREDALAKLDAFKARLPRLFGNYLRLDHLDPDAARAAIVQPLARYQELTGERCEVEPALVDAVLEEVAAGKIDAARQGKGVARRGPRRRRVEAPYLQLVMQRLWDVERERGSSVLRLSTLRELGGAERIVESHLERAMGSLNEAQRDAAATMFDHLVTPSGTKIAHRVSDLATYAHVDPRELEPILSSLARERIVRPLENGHNDGGYEIYHDVLAAAVVEWRQRHEAERQVVEERVRARERQRKTLVALGVVAAGLALMTLFAVYAFAQRAEAREQTAVARQQRAEAERQAMRAERNADKARRNSAAARANAAAARRNLAEARKQERRAQVNAARANREQQRAERSEGETKATLGLLRETNDALRDETARANTAATAARKETRQKQLALERAERSESAAERSAKAARGEEARATRLARRSRAGELVALSRAQLATDPSRSLASALAASRLDSTARVEAVLQEALMALRLEAVLPVGGAVRAAGFSPDGAMIAAASERGGVRLFRTRDARLLRVLGATRGVRALDFSPDGRLLATGGERGAVQIRSSDTGAVIRSLSHSRLVSGVEFSRDARLLLTASDDGLARVWEVASGLLLRRFAHARAIRGAVLSPDGTILVTHTTDRAARVYSVSSGDLVAPLEQQGEITDIAFSPTGETVVTTGRRNVYVWDARTWDLRHLLPGHTAVVRDVAYSNDGKTIVTVGVDGLAKIWSVETGALENSVSGHRNTPVAAAFSPDATMLVTGSTDKTARLWARARVAAPPVVLAGHRATVTRVEFSSDGSTILTASDDGTIRLWRAVVDPPLREIGSHAPAAVTTVRTSADSRFVLSAGSDGAARLWRIGGGGVRAFVHGGRGVRAVFGQRSRVVLTYGDDGNARLWETATARPIALFAHGAPVAAAALSPDGRWVVTAGADGVARVWLSNGQMRHVLRHGGELAALAITPNGRVVATAGADGAIALWDLRTSRRVATLVGHRDAVTALAFSPDGRRLASASADHTARVWGVRTGRVVELVGHDDVLTSVVFHPRGRVVLTTSRGEDDNVILWDAASGRALRDFVGHVSTVADARFSRDGRWIVTAGPSAAGLWRARDATLIAFVRGEASPVRSVSFTNDGRWVATGSADGSVRSYRCVVCGTLRELRAAAAQRLAQLERRAAAARGR